MGQPEAEDRWKDRRILAACLGTAVVLFPIAGAVGLAYLFERLVPRPVTVLPLVLWCLAALGCSTAAFFAAERSARRALPLSALLRMGLAFPDRAPRRLAVAWRAASVRDLDRQVAAARMQGVSDEPTVAAERIVTLAAAINAHDRTTRGHSERVRALTDMIADELRLPPADRDRLRWSALLHDVGKLAVHPEVLNKPGSLDEAEWEQIRRHPLEGAKLTEPLAAWLGSWASTIAEHHERYDGAGYPAGLSGKEISRGGRIVAVADSYDVMTAARSYKKPIGPGAARRELAECAGGQFDPEVVRAFLAVSIWRLRAVAPLSWLASLGSARFAAVSRIPAGAAQAVVSGLAAAGVVAGLSLAPVGRPPQLASPAGRSGVRAGPSGQGSTGAPGAGRGSSTTTTGPPGGNPTTSTGTPGTGGTTTSLPGGSSTTTTTTGGGSTSATTSTTVAGSTTTTTTTTTTTVPGSGGTTTSTTTTTTTLVGTTTTTTTTTLPPAPAPPTDLAATPGCELIVLVPQISLAWDASATPSVSSYVVLRRAGGGSYAPLATVPASTTSYEDSTVAAATTYWYEVEAIGPGGSATSAATSAATPPLCL